MNWTVNPTNTILKIVRTNSNKRENNTTVNEFSENMDFVSLANNPHEDSDSENEDLEDGVTDLEMAGLLAMLKSWGDNIETNGHLASK